MPDPLSLVPLATAAGAGTVDDFEAQQLVAAGLTLLRRSAPLVRALQGKRAAILLPTSHRVLTALAASEGRGAVLVNPLCSALEVAAQVRDADVGAAFTVSALAGRLPEDLPRVLLDESPRSAVYAAGGTNTTLDLGTHLGLPLEGEIGVPGSPDEAAIVYTSAMGGRPLGAILTHRNLLGNAHATVEAGAIGTAERSLAILPFSHLFGLVVSGLAPLLAGGRVRTLDRFNPIRALEILRAESITQLVGVPSVFHGMLAAIERGGAKLSAGGLRLCICGGAPLDPELQRRWLEVTGTELRQGYGLTEAGPVCLFNRVNLPNRIGALGVPFPGVAVEIHSPDEPPGRTLPVGARGEIRVRGENVFAGYVGGRSDGLTVTDGWLHTGDLGVENADGSFSFEGLIKPMFTRNGFNIYPRELEQAIGEMPGVQRVRVSAAPDPIRENDIIVDVEGDVTADAVKAWCRERLAAYKQPSIVNA